MKYHDSGMSVLAAVMMGLLWGASSCKTAGKDERKTGSTAKSPDVGLGKLSCAQLLERYRSIEKKKPQPCQANSDCVFFESGFRTCGGIVNQTTGRRLKPIRQEMIKRCRKTNACRGVRAWFHPVCHRGACTDRCDVLLNRFRAVLKSAPNTCKRDTDCARYRGGYVGCYGVVDKPTSQKLEALVQQMRQVWRRCGRTVDCAAREARPLRCLNGLCGEQSRR